MLAQIKQFFALTQNFFIYSLVASVVIFFVQFSPAILTVLGSGSQTPNDTAQKTISQYVVQFLQWLSSLPQANNVIVGLFWGTAAVLLYLLYITVANMYIATRNEVVLDTDKEAKNTGTDVLVKRLGTKIIVGILYFIYLVLSIVYLLPYCMNLLHIYVYSGMVWKDFAYFIGGILGLTVVLYLISASAFVIWKYEQSV